MERIVECTFGLDAVEVGADSDSLVWLALEAAPVRVVLTVDTA